MTQHWFEVKEPLTLEGIERDKFLRFKAIGPRAKLAEANGCVDMAESARQSGDYPLYNKLMAESAALEGWAERELQGLPY